MPHLDTEVDSLFFYFSSDEEYEEEEEEEEYEEEVQTNPDEYEILFFCPQPVSEIYQTNPPIYIYAANSDLFLPTACTTNISNFLPHKIYRDIKGKI